MRSMRRLIATTAEREDRDDPLHRDVVAGLEVVDELAADPRPVERLLSEDRAREKQRGLQAGDGDDRDERVAEGVPDDDGRAP